MGGGGEGILVIAEKWIQAGGYHDNRKVGLDSESEYKVKEKRGEQSQRTVELGE